jgi:hypothetical protein
VIQSYILKFTLEPQAIIVQDKRSTEILNFNDSEYTPKQSASIYFQNNESETGKNEIVKNLDKIQEPSAYFNYPPVRTNHPTKKAILYQTPN